LEIIRILFLNSKRLVLLSILSGILSAALSIGVIYFINTYISGQINTGFSFELAVYSLIVVAMAITGYWAQKTIAKLGFDVTFNLRSLLIKKVLGTKQEVLEKMGTSELYACVTVDIEAINMGVAFIPLAIVNIATVCAGLAYLIMISWKTIFLMIIAIAGVYLIGKYLSKQLGKLFFTAREISDKIYKNYEGFFDGTKEIKAYKNFAKFFFYKKFIPLCEQSVDVGTKITGAYAFSYRAQDILFYTIIGFVLFFSVTTMGLSKQDSVSVVLTLLFIRGPGLMLFEVVPTVSRGSVSLSKIRQLTGAEGTNLVFENEKNNLEGGFESLELCDVYYNYTEFTDMVADHPFQLGPINMSIQRGQTIFITGGNGSGKTTLAKILTGLYQPISGQIVAKSADLSVPYELTDNIAPIYSDFYLFNDMAELYFTEHKKGKLNALVDQLELSNHIDFEKSKIPTKELSQGQKKRLALLFAVASGREIFLFDEWAADQDPIFREYFYLSILPILKRDNRTTIVITHDDKYFNYADVLYKLDKGIIASVHKLSSKIIQEESPTLVE
jgi:multidrug/microcin transport system ATP-binding/permease protein